MFVEQAPQILQHFRPDIAHTFFRVIDPDLDGGAFLVEKRFELVAQVIGDARRAL